MPKVCKTINLIGPGYTVVTLHPGDDVPDWALDKVTNPAVLAKECDSSPATAPLVTVPIVPAANAEGHTEVIVEAIDYTKLDRKELDALCTERGLALDGNKPDLIARLEEADKAPAAEEVFDVFALDTNELKALAAERDIDISGATTDVEIATVIDQAQE